MSDPSPEPMKGPWTTGTASREAYAATKKNVSPKNNICEPMPRDRVEGGLRSDEKT